MKKKYNDQTCLLDADIEIEIPYFTPTLPPTIKSHAQIIKSKSHSTQVVFLKRQPQLGCYGGLAGKVHDTQA